MSLPKIIKFMSLCTFSFSVIASETRLPEWIYQSKSDDGLVASSCVNSSSSISVDLKVVSLNARIELAKSVASKIKVQSEIISNNQKEIAMVFSELASAVSETTLAGSEIVRREPGTNSGKPVLCAQAHISDKSLKKSLVNMMTKASTHSGISLNKDQLSYANKLLTEYNFSATDDFQSIIE